MPTSLVVIGYNKGVLSILTVMSEYSPVKESYDFSDALHFLTQGKKVARKGWNGKGIFIQIQLPDENSFMTSPYIYIDTTGLQTDNPNAPKSRVPWLASQTDLLADDWVIVY